jgi:AcrR family transcriptional regulator
MSPRPLKSVAAPTAAELKPPRRRYPAAERRKQILRVAATFFAEHGFQGSTRHLADQIGITQAALYKHFSNKDALIAALFDASAERWRTEDWRIALSDTSLTLDDRLIQSYEAYLAHTTATGLRLFMRAGLDGLGQPARRGAMLTASILEPIIDAVRSEAGVPPVSKRPLTQGEREVAMALHGGLMFLAIRKHIYRMPMPDNLRALIALQVRLWLPGAITEIRRLHAAGGQPRQLVPRAKRRP